jgi:PASTA domain
MTVGRLGTFVPRLAALTVVWLLATAALTYAAAQKSPAAPKTAATTATTTAAPTTLTVPDVRRQAYTFAKGSLTDAGFAWKIAGAVRGYASNTVVGQTPAPGTEVVDTGAPTVVLTLAKSGSQLGVPEQVSSIRGTSVKIAGLASAELRATHVKRTAAPKKTPAVTKGLATKTPTRTPAKRPPAFVVPGARREPLSEMPLTTRADILLKWLSGHPAANDANVKRWLFQHAWIVAGARMGWWHGDQALQTLLKADDRVWQIWGIGARSERIAKQALAEVEARQR